MCIRGSQILGSLNGICILLAFRIAALKGAGYMLAIVILRTVNRFGNQNVAGGTELDTNGFAAEVRNVFVVCILFHDDVLNRGVVLNGEVNRLFTFVGNGNASRAELRFSGLNSSNDAVKLHVFNLQLNAKGFCNLHAEMCIRDRFNTIISVRICS